MTDDKNPSLVPNGGYVVESGNADDLTDRCLKHADILTADNWHTEAATLREAAAEIERLNAQLLAASEPFTGVSG